MNDRKSFFSHIYREIDWNDWRVKWVVGATTAACAVSVILYYSLPQLKDVSTFSGAIFASWVAGLLLTIVITAVITIIQFSRPDKELFESRARNLLRRQKGSHIDYIVEEMRNFFAPFCESSQKRIVISEYVKSDRIFRISQHTTNTIRGYIDDISVPVKSQLAYENWTPAPNGREGSSLSYLSVNGERIHENIYFSKGEKFPFETEIPPGSACVVEHRMSLWVQDSTEPNRHKATRFTKSLIVSIENQLERESVGVILKPEKEGGPETCITIPPGQKVEVINEKDIRPHYFVYDFRLKAL